EEKLLEIFSQLEGKKVLICGKENRPDGNRLGTEIIGIARSDQIENLILQSRLVICRSGYTSVADLLKLRENALLVPTPGQPEQIYLAKRCREKDWFTTADQKELTTEIFTHAIEKNKPKPRANMEWSGSEIITRFLK
ncbi:MAG TPA: glycosyltransferase, partial [Cryomorphaceae bacterium]|nr:glycosyltransferase [Cryomorphaceae bacterium]